MNPRDELVARAGLREATLVHYDIRESNIRARRELSRFLSGRVDSKSTKSGRRTYRYPGLLSMGGRRIGQSVFLLEPDLADRLIKKLQELRVRYWTTTLYEES